MHPYDVPTDQIMSERDRLLAEANQILARADNDDLTGAEAEEFEELERCANVLTYRARCAAPVSPLAAACLPDTETPEEQDPSVRRVGGLTPIHFSGEQLRQLHGELLSNRPSAATIETRAVTAVPSMPTFKLDPVTLLRERTRLAQLMPAQTVESSSVTYYTTSTGATAAGTVAPGALKPESTPGWTPVETPIRKIAHFADVPKEALDDFANFASIVGDEMTAGVYNAESLQLLSGNGVAPNIRGLLSTSGILTYAPVAAEARYVSIRHAISLLQAAFIEPDVVVLHPSDAKLFDLSNSASAGLHANLDTAGDGTRTAWGLRIVVTSMIASGTALVANLAESTILFMREPARIFVDPFSQSANNLVRFIAEERVGLGVTRPSGLLEITFNGTS